MKEHNAAHIIAILSNLTRLSMLDLHRRSGLSYMRDALEQNRWRDTHFLDRFYVGFLILTRQIPKQITRWDHSGLFPNPFQVIVYYMLSISALRFDSENVVNEALKSTHEVEKLWDMDDNLYHSCMKLWKSSSQRVLCIIIVNFNFIKCKIFGIEEIS